MRKTILAQKHHKSAIKRRNFFPTLIVTILLWLALGGLVYFVDPQTFGAVFLFFALAFLSLLFTFSLVFANTRRGLVIASGGALFLALGYLGVGNILNFLLITAIAVCIEVYFYIK